ncbi:MAG: hypothetical protein J6J66_04625 [Clostridia bacterium]|nr:hypothetical protein [Clostridia bacterium]
MRKTLKSLWTSAIALTLCVSMLLGTTFAWFTDSVSSDRNIIAAGNLDVELEYLKGDSWKPVREDTNVFKDAKWEPGYTEVVYLRVSNLGSLALKYMLSVKIASEIASINVNGESFRLSEFIKIGAVDGVSTPYSDRGVAQTAVESSARGLRDGYTKTSRLEEGDVAYVALVLYMPESVGNEANRAKGEAVPKIDLGLNLVATQADSETDGFGNGDYDANAGFPALTLPGAINKPVEKDAQGNLLSDTVIEDSEGKVKAEIPAGIPLAEGVDTLSLLVKEMESSGANLTLADNEILRSLNVHIEGIADGNTTPTIITVKEALMPGLNLGNLKLVHVEDGVNKEMVRVNTLADLDAHNEFVYDPATGDITLAMASFSEVALVADTENKWEGAYDDTWYNTTDTEFTIANADQLAAFGAIVGGMIITVNENVKSYKADSFKGKTVKLIADVNLGDKESENNPDIIFYPIGYYNSEGTYERTNTAITSGMRNFEGVFDGNGHTIANFYQNTWEMKGDHDWYDATLQYYRDGMGLFGRVYGGTVKNLTVKNFSSDGEIATTGTIAAYGEGATFENIAIFNCNPRVYNIGNGGIVGCVGWYAKDAGLKTTFTNITVDNSNKISALWGSYDVACGGIVGQYYPTSGQSSAGTPKNGGIEFVNCHISAQMDVYNDVCANYQYYAYRYAGILLGSVRENETINGHVYPKMDGITARGCTVHFGDWNDYYYCELVANSLASYTHDHQMSRLEQVKAVNVANMTVTDLAGNTTAIPTSGRVNYVVVKAKDANGKWIHGDGHDYAECYHFVNGVQHFHDVADADNPNPTETVNGVAGVLKEDKQLVYREFNNLVTGYGWGVTSKGVGEMDGVTILDRIEGNSVEKFTGKVNELDNNKEYTLGDIFNFVDNGVEVVPDALTVSISNLNENNPVSATIKYDRDNWANSTITFAGTGDITITIQDYYFCTPTTITVNVKEREAVEKFTAKDVNKDAYTSITLGDLFEKNGVDIVGNITATINYPDKSDTTFTGTEDDFASHSVSLIKDGEYTITLKDEDEYCKVVTAIITVNKVDKFTKKFDKDFLYRVGNATNSPVALGTLFEEIGSGVQNVSADIEKIAGDANGTFTSNATWMDGKIQFSGTGVVKVTISADGANAVELNLEVVDAVNATGATDATENNVVLLNDISDGFTVSGSYTVFGNGFTLNYTGNGQYLNNGLRQGVVNVSENGRLDNLRIKASIYPSSYLYYDEVKNGPSSVEGDRTRYHYQLSAVVAKDNATISNCYIYGGRNNIFVDTGNVTITDTVTECGTLANIQIQSTNASTVTLSNVTTIQHRVNATIGDTTQVMMGAGVIVGPDTETNPTIILNGEFKQYNWVTAEDKAAITNSTAQTIIQTALDATAFNHTVNEKTSSNLGIIYLNDVDASVINNTGLPYKMGSVKMMGENGKVYSLQNATESQIYSDYVNADKSTVNGDYLPTFEFDLGDQEISYDGSEDTRYLYGDKNGITALYKDGEAALTLDLTKLAKVYKYKGILYDVTAVCKDSSGNTLTASNGIVTLDAQGSYTLEFSVVDNIFYDKNGETVTKSVDREYSVPLQLTVKAADIKNAVVNITKTALDGVYTTVNLTDYKLRINFLDCISITDYDNKGTGTTVNLTSNIKSATLTPSGVNVFTTASTITVTYTDGQVLTVNLSNISGSSAGTKTATVNTSGGLYFITEGALDNKPTEASSQNKCTITSVSYKGYSGSTVTNDTDVTVTWELGSSSSEGTCLAAGTLITLIGGEKKAVEDLRKGDIVMTLDHLTGEITYKDVIIVVKTHSESYYKNTFIFDDGTSLVTINEHGIFDLDLNKYVNIDHLNYQEFVGHKFVSIDTNGNIGVKRLVDVTTVCESGYKYDIVTNGTLNYVAEDTLSVTHVLVDVINSFDFGEDLMYDAEKMVADIEKYGLYAYDEWEAYCDISVFDQYNIPVMKVGISKGLYTKEYIIGLINTYVLDDSVQILD